MYRQLEHFFEEVRVSRTVRVSRIAGLSAKAEVDALSVTKGGYIFDNSICALLATNFRKICSSFVLAFPGIRVEIERVPCRGESVIGPWMSLLVRRDTFL